MKCGSCGRDSFYSYRFCTFCGVEFDFDREMMNCPSCGHRNEWGARFCNLCGKALELVETDKGEKEKWSDKTEKVLPCPRCGWKNLSLSGFCGDCGVILKDPFPEIYKGKQFYFINATETCPAYLNFSSGFSNSEPEQVLTHPAIFSVYKYNKIYISNKKGGCQRYTESDFYRGSQSGIRFTSMVSDKKVYESWEEIKIAVLSPSLADKERDVTLYRKGKRNDIIYSKRLDLDDQGVGLLTFPGADQGEYDVSLNPDGGTISLTVAEYSLSLLEARLIKYEIDKQNLNVNIMITRLNKPYSGSLTVELWNGGGNAIDKKNINLTDGDISLSFDLRLDFPPYNIRIITPQGDTAQVPLEETASQSIEKIPLGFMRQQWEGSCVPFPGSTYTNGIFSASSGINGFPIRLEEIISDTGRLTALSPLKRMQMVLINPVDGSCELRDFEDIRIGWSVTFPLQHPYTLIHCGCWGEDLLSESWGVVFRKSEINLSVDVPSEAKPGEEITLKMESSTPVSALVSIRDLRMESENPFTKYKKNIYDIISFSGKNLSFGPINKASRYSFSYIEPEVCYSVPEYLCQKYKIIPIDIINNRIILAMADPLDVFAIDDVRLITGMEVQPVIATEEAIMKSINRMFGVTDLAEVQDIAMEDLGDIECDRLIEVYNPNMSALRTAPVDIPPMNIHRPESIEKPPSTRSDFPDMIFFDIIKIDGKTEKKIKLGEHGSVQGFRLCFTET